MGKIEDCFGSHEEAQLYGLAAFEQPIIRLTFEDANPDNIRLDIASQLVYIKALAGIVVSPDVIEPEHDHFPHPAIRIQPISNASITIAKNPKRLIQTEEYTINSYDEAHSLLLQRPINEPDKFEPVLKDMVKNAKGALTISRALPIREAMNQLKRHRDVYPHGRILHDLSKIALANIWS